MSEKQEKTEILPVAWAIARVGWSSGRDDVECLAEEITAAILAERERCAQLAGAMFADKEEVGGEDACHAWAGREIAGAIRQGGEA